MTRPSLTERQRRILQYIEREITRRGHSPTIREIGEQFGITSTNGVRTHLTALIRKGYLKKTEFISRGLELARSMSAGIDRVPLVGSVPAGNPIDSAENIEGELAIDESFLPAGEKFSLLVKGESMTGAGILDGDTVIVKKQSEAEKGDIVVAIVDGEATVKRYFPERDKIRLQPENEEFEPILVSSESGEFRIAGKVVSLLRRLR